MRARVFRKRTDGSQNFSTPYRLLALDRVRHVGDPVAAIVADSIAEAKDAAELIEVEYESLPSVTDTAGTLSPDAPAVWDEAPGNICFVEHIGNEEKVKAAFAQAKHVVKERFVINRVAVNPMEARTALGVYDTREERYILPVSYTHLDVYKRQIFFSSTADSMLGNSSSTTR